MAGFKKSKRTDFSKRGTYDRSVVELPDNEQKKRYLHYTKGYRPETEYERLQKEKINA